MKKKSEVEKFKNHCHPAEGQILDGDRALCKRRCDKKHREGCRDIYNG